MPLLGDCLLALRQFMEMLLHCGQQIIVIDLPEFRAATVFGKKSKMCYELSKTYILGFFA